MSEIIKRTFQCTGCGMARPCFLTTNQEKGEIEFYDHTEHLKCVLDETNKTAPNWTEVEANGVIKPHEKALPMCGVVQQRVLLTAFMEYLEAIPEFPENDVLIENFIVEGGL